MAIHLLMLILTTAVWFYVAFPVLRYAIDLSEGRFRWQIVLWFIALLLDLQVLKRSVLLLTGWPQENTWGSRLFLALALILTYFIPFIWEILKSIFQKKV